MLLNYKSEKLFAEFDQCQKRNEHLNIKEQLTSADIEKMLWLSSDMILKSQGENKNKKNKDKDIKIIVIQ